LSSTHFSLSSSGVNSGCARAIARRDKPTAMALSDSIIASRSATVARRSNSIWTFSASGEVSESMFA
jgi:hypothetical protein